MKPEDAIDILENLKVCKQAHTLFNIEKKAVDMAVKALKEQRPHGEWIDSINDNICSVCKQNSLTRWKSPFCPNCGSDNRKRGEAE